MSGTATPWWDALKLRDEIVDASGAIDDVQMSLNDSVYGRGSLRPPYADPAYYGEITHPTGQLVDLLSKLAVRIGGGDDYVGAPALIRLDQGMGGGKSHACIGAWLLADRPADFAKTDIGKAVRAHAADVLGRDLPADLNRPRVVVLAGDSMTPGAPVHEIDGPAKNLWERFLWRLFDRDYARFEDYRPYFNDKAKVIDALRSVGRPVLIIADEIVNYIGNGLDGAGDEQLTGQDMGFLRVLLDAVNDVPNVAMLVVMIASDKDTIALSDPGARRRDEINSLLERNGRLATVNENADFAAILRRRLFDQPPVKEVVDATVAGFMPVLQDKGWRGKVLDQITGPWVDTASFPAQTARAYPFHPQLMHMAESEWANMTGFQKVRSTIRVFAATVWALQRRAKSGQWVPALIGLGDLPLNEPTVRESILGSGLITDPKTAANYRSLSQNDIVSVDDTAGAARLIDLGREGAAWSKVNPRAAERAATTVFLASIVGARGQGKRGASEAEVKAATIVPTTLFTVADADGVISDIKDADTGLAALEPIPGKGGTQPRLYLSTKQTLIMLARAARNTITDADRDAFIAGMAESLAATGPFKKKIFVRADADRTPIETLADAGLDDARVTRLAVLDPAGFSLRNGMEEATVDALRAAVGLGDQRLISSWASSIVFAVVNTQRRSFARSIAVEYLAWDRVLDAPEIEADESLREKATAEKSEARTRLQKALRRAYQHVAYLAQPDPESARELAQVTFDDDSQTSLDGGFVWKKLVESEKAFDTGQFTAKALLHQLRDSDYGRPLPELRDAFWQAPRLPLLHDGEADLRRAIYQAVLDDDLRIVGRDGTTVAVTGSNEINLGASSLTIAKPDAVAPTDTPGEDITEPGPDNDKPESDAPRPDLPDSADQPEGSTAPTLGGEHVSEKQLTMTVIQKLDDDTIDQTAALLRRIYEVIERGDSSYLQGQIRLIVKSQHAGELERLAKEAGITATVQDQ